MHNLPSRLWGKRHNRFEFGQCRSLKEENGAFNKKEEGKEIGEWERVETGWTFQKGKAGEDPPEQPGKIRWRVQRCDKRKIK